MEAREQKPRSRFVFVVGGVMSSVGKGIAAASIANLFEAKGYRTTNVKCDMYINIDAGTIRPTEHGEVFVGEDGIEADQDLGNYERFTGRTMSALNYLTTGQVYQEVIRRERNLEYEGEDVEVVPHIPNEIIRRLELAATTAEAEVTVVEFGGTLGEYQVLLFLEAARLMKWRHPDEVAFVLVSYLPVPSHVGEMKTKPTQHAARLLHEAAIQADVIIARGPEALDEKRREKLALSCNVPPGRVISAPDVASIYDVPLLFEEQQLDEHLIKLLELPPKTAPGSDEWRSLTNRIHNAEKPLKIAVVGKYFETGAFTLADSYISVIEAIKHAVWSVDCKPVLEWVSAEEFERDPSSVQRLRDVDGVLIPGGFGARGVEGLLTAIRFVREEGIPYFGICYGMQLACIEMARNVLHKPAAHTTEVAPETPDPVIHLNPLQAKNVLEKKYGATMRLGSYDCALLPGSVAATAYGAPLISERHRHRYEFNEVYREPLAAAGLIVSGENPDTNLVEIVELASHPFFVGVQFHPEFQSTPLVPHPLFVAFSKAAMQRASERA